MVGVANDQCNDVNNEEDDERLQGELDHLKAEHRQIAERKGNRSPERDTTG